MRKHGDGGCARPRELWSSAVSVYPASGKAPRSALISLAAVLWLLLCTWEYHRSFCISLYWARLHCYAPCAAASRLAAGAPAARTHESINVWSWILACGEISALGSGQDSGFLIMVDARQHRQIRHSETSGGRSSRTQKKHWKDACSRRRHNC